MLQLYVIDAMTVYRAAFSNFRLRLRVHTYEELFFFPRGLFIIIMFFRVTGGDEHLWVSGYTGARQIRRIFKDARSICTIHTPARYTYATAACLRKS